MGNEERAFWYDGDGNAAAFVIYDAAGMHPYYSSATGRAILSGCLTETGTLSRVTAMTAGAICSPLRIAMATTKQTIPPLSVTKIPCATAAITTIPKQNSTTSRAATTIRNGAGS